MTKYVLSGPSRLKNYKLLEGWAEKTLSEPLTGQRAGMHLYSNLYKFP